MVGFDSTSRVELKRLWLKNGVWSSPNCELLNLGKTARDEKRLPSFVVSHVLTIKEATYESGK